MRRFVFRRGLKEVPHKLLNFVLWRNQIRLQKYNFLPTDFWHLQNFLQEFFNS